MSEYWEPLVSADEAALEVQLGRPLRDALGVAARCACGAPAVVVTKPRLSDGTPFPTLYYLSLPSATREASRLEAAGLMAVYQQRLSDDTEQQNRYRLAHEDYLHTREQWGVVPEIEGISAGGMPERVKCLHALIAHALARGPGVNPVGDWALEEANWSLGVCQCNPE